MMFLRRLHIPLLNMALDQIESFSPNARWFLLSTIISGITFSGFQLFFNLYILARGFDQDFLGLINAVPSGAALLVGVPMGLLSDRIGRRRAMLIGMSVTTMAFWVLVNASSQAVMVAASAVQGIANSLYYLSTAPFMMSASDRQNRTMLFSLNFALQTVAGFAGNLLAGQLPAWFGARLGVGAESAQAYQAVLLASIVGGAFMLAPLLLIREPRWPGPSHVSPPTLADLKQLFRPTVLKLATPNIIIGFGAATLIPYMNVFFKGKFPISDAELGVLFSPIPVNENSSGSSLGRFRFQDFQLADNVSHL
jgi:MFS family permease